MTHRERVNLAISHKETDRVPRDFAAEPGIWKKLFEEYGFENKEAVLKYFDCDMRVVSFDFECFFKPNEESKKTLSTKTWRHSNNGIYTDAWGAKRRIVENDFGTYEELTEYPLADAQTIDDIKKHPFPSPDDWDFSSLRDVCNKISDNGEYHLRYRIGANFEVAWSLLGLEKCFMDMVLNPDMVSYLMDRILEIHLVNLERVLEEASDLIDMVYHYDDVAHQKGLLMSEDMWGDFIAKRHEKIYALAKKYGKQTMYHSCGAVRPLINRFIDIGLDVLNPIQPLAEGMDFPEIKKEFGDKITFHGGIDIQETLPKGSVSDVTSEVERALNILGKNGGYILSPAHHVQSDTPIENVFAIYGVSPPK